MTVDPKAFYTPSQIVKYGFIKKSPRHIKRLCQQGEIKAEKVKVLAQHPTYQILGADIIKYRNRKVEEKRSKAKKPHPTASI